MTTEEKFNAAVNVIKSLPKNGSYQPSNELMLRFYGYFKQATQGPCTGNRPAFWDIVGRAKYDAHKILGDMSKQEAMKNYVDELHRIVETMSYSSNVANFLEAPPSELNSISMADLELVVGDVMERVRSQSNSPISSRNTSPERLNSGSPVSSVDVSSSPTDSDYSDDEYIDSFDVPHQPKKSLVNGVVSSDPLSNGYIPGKEHTSRVITKTTLGSSDIDISKEISQTVHSLKIDIENLTSKINALECGNYSVRRKNVLSSFTPRMFVFLIIWPFLASYLMHRFLHRK